MTPEAQRIAIAEACGLEPLGPDSKGIRWANSSHAFTGSWLTQREPERHHGMLPNYLSDLNAMHEAELACLNFNEQESADIFNYRCALTTICGHDLSFVLHATAEQRAEALLKAISKWEDDK